jgi:hypothetical protein
MASGDARYGRRDNGLVAAEYAAAGDVDPRVGEHLLDVLALDGIAAYLRPSTDLHPVTRSSSLPARPTDRLYVDRLHLATARSYLARLNEPSGGPAEPSQAPPDEPSVAAGPEDLDEAWAEIVAGYNDEVDPPHRSWPAAEDVPDVATADSRPEPVPPAAALTLTSPTIHPAADEPSLLDGLDTFGAGLPDTDEEGYTPPPPPPVPRPSLPTALSIVGIIGGLIVFLRPDVLPVAEGTAMVVGFIAIVAGFATLVWRLRPGDSDDIDPDDGARV